MDALSLLLAAWMGGAALEGRALNSLGFQPQAAGVGLVSGPAVTANLAAAVGLATTTGPAVNGGSATTSGPG